MGRPDGEPGVVLRPLAADDSIDELTAMLHRAYAELAAMGLRFTATHQDSETTRRRIQGAQCFVATVDNQIVGTILLRPPGPRSTKVALYARDDVATVGQFGVEPSFQRRGIGSMLLRQAEQRARELGVTELALDTSEQAHHLIDLYTRWGFRVVDNVQWETVNYRSVVMSRPIPPEE